MKSSACGAWCQSRGAKSSTDSISSKRPKTIDTKLGLHSAGKMFTVTLLLLSVFITESASMYNEDNSAERNAHTGLSFDDQIEASHVTDATPFGYDANNVEETSRSKKWTAPENKSRARGLYNYFLTKGLGSDIFGKRMGGSSFPSKSFRFFSPDVSGAPGYHGSEFLGKRGIMQFRNTNNAPVSEFLGKRSGTPEIPDKRDHAVEVVNKRARISEFLGKRAGVSEFLGKRTPDFNSPDKRVRASEFLGKRARISEFLGKRDDSASDVEKRTRASEFLGKRARISEFLGKRARISEFLGKRYNNAYKNQMMRTGSGRVSEFLGKRSGNSWSSDSQDATESEEYPDGYFYEV